MTDNERVYDRYLKVLTMLERGEEGEQLAAINAKKKLEQAHPWVVQYHASQVAQSQAQNWPNSNYRRSGLSWENFFDAADRIFTTFRDFSDAAYGMQRARLLADQCKLQLQGSDSVGLTFTLHIPPSVHTMNQTVLSREQRDAFMETLMDRIYGTLAEQIYTEAR